RRHPHQHVARHAGRQLVLSHEDLADVFLPQQGRKQKCENEKALHELCTASTIRSTTSSIAKSLVSINRYDASYVSGESARVESCSSRCTVSASTFSYGSGVPRPERSVQRRAARTSGLAVRKNLCGVSGKTFV